MTADKIKSLSRNVCVCDAALSVMEGATLEQAMAQAGLHTQHEKEQVLKLLEELLAPPHILTGKHHHER